MADILTTNTLIKSDLWMDETIMVSGTAILLAKRDSNWFVDGVCLDDRRGDERFADNRPY